MLYIIRIKDLVNNENHLNASMKEKKRNLDKNGDQSAI